MKKIVFTFVLIGCVGGGTAFGQNPNASTNVPPWITRPLSLADCLNIALSQNATILKAKNDLEASQGLVITTRAVALPHLTADGNYGDEQQSLVQNFPGNTMAQPHRNWATDIEISQTIYDGGKSIAALRSASVTKRQSLATYQTAVADTLLSVRLAYYDVLLAEQARFVPGEGPQLICAVGKSAVPEDAPLVQA